MADIDLKRLVWVASSFRDFCSLPRDVVREMGFALFVAQGGDKHPHAKPLRGFTGAKVLEIVEDHATDTYRCIYTVQIMNTIYVPTRSRRSRSEVRRRRRRNWPSCALA